MCFTFSAPCVALTEAPCTPEMTMHLQYQLKAGSYYLYDMRESPSALSNLALNRHPSFSF